MNFKNLRTYGVPPFNIAVIHGGPGAPGEMAPVARHLSSESGVLEPLQTATSLNGQVDELKSVLVENGGHPVTLIGYSWGAFLSFIFAARYPHLVTKLILIGSGAFEEKYAKDIMETRFSRLSQDEVEELRESRQQLQDPEKFALFGKLISKADSYNPLPYDEPSLECQPELFLKVWDEAAAMRRSGKLLELGKLIVCPVIAIHGAYDPHLSEGVEVPLARTLKDFTFTLLEKCGHTPWKEREAKEAFYQALRRELF